MRGLQKCQQICFVIDGTNSMSSDINNVKKAIKGFTKQDVQKEIAVIIYRDHDCKELLDQYPQNGNFTEKFEEVL